MLRSSANVGVMEAFTQVGHVRRAIKIFCKDKSSEAIEHKDMMHEVEVVKGLRHPCIVEVIVEAMMIVMKCAAAWSAVQTAILYTDQH